MLSLFKSFTELVKKVDLVDEAVGLFQHNIGDTLRNIIEAQEVQHRTNTNLLDIINHLYSNTKSLEAELKKVEAKIPKQLSMDTTVALEKFKVNMLTDLVVEYCPATEYKTYLDLVEQATAKLMQQQEKEPDNSDPVNQDTTAPEEVSEVVEGVASEVAQSVVAHEVKDRVESTTTNRVAKKVREIKNGESIRSGN